jgi:hypothetical protein
MWLIIKSCYMYSHSHCTSALACTSSDTHNW